MSLEHAPQRNGLRRGCRGALPRRTPGGFEPLLVTPTQAKQIINVRNTKFWELVKAGLIQLVPLGGRRMVVYASLKALTRPEPEAQAA